MDMARARITITYCAQCQWLLRSAWLAQEPLSTFGADLGKVALGPGTGGVFQIAYEGGIIWDRKHDRVFPEAKILKQRICDRLDPDRSLGHSDR
jgi:selenoprotein W-related protein